MDRPNCRRDNFLRNRTDPSAAVPCSWNTFFARSTPMMLISFMDARRDDLRRELSGFLICMVGAR